MIVITGATGTIGRELLTLLPREEVVAVARRPLPGHVLGDLERPETVAAHLSPGDRLFLNSSLFPGVADAHRAVIDLAREAGVAQVVTISVRHARPGGRLGQDLHGRIDEHLRASGLPHVILRPGGFLQNLPAEVRGGRFHGSYGDAKVSYIDARDIAAVAAAVLTAPVGPDAIHTLTGPEPLTHAEIAAAITAETGRQVTYVDHSVPDMAAHLAAQGVPEPVAAELAAMMHEMGTEDWASTTSAVQDLTGRPPRSLRDFLADHADAFAEQ